MEINTLFCIPTAIRARATEPVEFFISISLGKMTLLTDTQILVIGESARLRRSDRAFRNWL
jgi:hypothetical protein